MAEGQKTGLRKKAAGPVMGAATGPVRRAGGNAVVEPGAERGGRRARRSAETRLRIFRAAMRLIAERGFAEVTVEQITEAADVGKGTFFNYFSSKEQVLGVLAEIQIGKVRAALERVGAEKISVRCVLRRLVAALAEEPGQSPELARALIGAFVGNPQVRERIRGVMAEGREMVAEIVACGQARRQIDPRLKKERVALGLQQMVMGTMLFWSLNGDAELAVSHEESFQLYWRAIAYAEKE